MRIIPIYGGFNAKVDDADFEKLYKLKWSIGGGAPSRRYLVAYKSRIGMVYMHREILEPKKSEIIDHIDGDIFNNQKSNLRICSQKQNCWNSQKRKDGTSKFKGVFFDNSRNKWISKIFRNGKAKFIGRFEQEIHAAIAYNNAAIKMSGEYAYINKI